KQNQPPLPQSCLPLRKSPQRKASILHKFRGPVGTEELRRETFSPSLRKVLFLFKKQPSNNPPYPSTSTNYCPADRSSVCRCRACASASPSAWCSRSPPRRS